MKTLVLAGTMALVVFSGQATATCGGGGYKRMYATAGTPGSSTLLLSSLGGKVMCVGAGSPWTNQEFHNTNGDLIDFKGGSSPSNPTEKVGTWLIVGNQIKYTYGEGTGAVSYSFDVYEKSPDYSFCVGTTSNAEAKAKTGTFTAAAACP